MNKLVIVVESWANRNVAYSFIVYTDGLLKKKEKSVYVRINLISESAKTKKKRGKRLRDFKKRGD